MSTPDAAESPALPYRLQMVDAGDGYRVPLFWHAAAQPRGNILLMAALGVPARFYLPLAQELCASGLNVALIEQRGHVLIVTMLGVGIYAWLNLRRRLRSLPGWDSAVTPTHEAKDVVRAH